MREISPYHLESRPIWFNDLNNKLEKIEKDQGVIYTGNPKNFEKNMSRRIWHYKTSRILHDR